MEELAAVPPQRLRERRHRRKASDAAAAARAAYGDVFGGLPRFAAPFAGVPGDYSEVFGGVAASCSIPYLDLPPAGDDGAGTGAGAYGEIFAQFDFGDFAAPYEDVFAEAEGMAEEIASWSGSSRSSVRNEFGELNADPSMLYQHYPNVGYDQHFDEERFSPILFPQDGEQQFSMSYNKATRGRPDDLVEMTTCMVEPSISYVIDSCNLSNDSETAHAPAMEDLSNGSETNHAPAMDNLSNGSETNRAPAMDNLSDGSETNQAPAVDNLLNDSETYHVPAIDNLSNGSEINHAPVMDNLFNDSETNHVPAMDILSNDSETFHVPAMDNGTLTNEENRKMSPQPFPASTDSVADQEQHIQTGLPISEFFYEVENYNKRLSTHSSSSEEAPSPDYPFLRVPNNSIHTLPFKVQPSSVLPTKLLNKKESKACGDSEVNPNSAAAAAAMKEAMEFAESRLKAAKELMEKKGDSFKLRKKPGHRRGTKSAEFKVSKTLEEVHVFEEKMNSRRLLKEEYECVDLLDKNTDSSAVKLTHGYRDEETVLPPGKPQQMMQSCSKIDQLGKWSSGADFFELISHDHAQQNKSNTVACEGDNSRRADPFSNPSLFEEGKGGVTAENLERYGKMCDGNVMTELKMKRVNLKDVAPSVEVEHKIPTASEVSLCEEREEYQETTDSQTKEYVGLRKSSDGNDNGGVFAMSCISRISPELHVVPEVSSLSPGPCVFGHHANDNKNGSDARAEMTPLEGRYNKDNNRKEGLEIPCADLTTTANNKTDAGQVEVANLEDSAESCDTQCFRTMSSTVHEEAETYAKDKPFSFVDEVCLQNEKEIITELSSEELIHEEKKTLGTDEKAGSDADFQDGDMDWDASSNFTSASSNANENEEAEGLNVFVGDTKLTERNDRTCGTFDEDSDQHQKPQGSLRPEDLANEMEGVKDLASHGNEKETKEPLLENIEKSLTEEIINHDKEGQTSTEIGSSKGLNDVYAEIIARNGRECNIVHSGTDIITDDYSGYTMKMSTCSEDPQASFSGGCVSKQLLSQNAESVFAQMCNESTQGLENLEEDCPKTESDFSTKEYAPLDGEMTRSKIEDRTHSVKLKDLQSFGEDPASHFVQTSKEETPDVQRAEGKDNVRKTERKIEKDKIFHRLDEEKEREYKTEKEQTKECSREELEEEMDRERERAKDRLAVQRATREAHERAFAEVRAKAERIALERITSTRQRASAEAREKEEKENAESTNEKIAREARIRAERAAVERATAEARERAIEKARAAAESKDRMEKFRSSFKDNFKAADQDIQYQKAAFNSSGTSTDSCNKVVEVESALRHKARSERHQRTSERVAKALAEKNRRDMLAQREQAEKHRLAEFLDPEVKRWSNGKEGNLRALLSTLQYILGSDSGWQSVPLTDLITAAAVKKAYRKATLCVHPDKLQQRGATIRQKYICEKVFDLLKEAWNKFNSGER